MESFSWSDSLRALAAPCLACLRPASPTHPDLANLLADSASGLTLPSTDAETLSLHSNPGTPRRQRARFGKHIRLFGWDLFGRPPIHLPDDDDDDDDSAQRRRQHRPRALASSTTLDSDAAPLDSAAIQSRATAHAEEEAARAARRARRRSRRETKRAALALALERGALESGEAEFEGFPGSGSGGGARVPPPYAPGPYRDYADGGGEADEEEDGDFGAGAYTRRAPGGSDSGRGSDSRSRTSASLSQTSGQHPHPHPHPQAYGQHHLAQQPQPVPAPRKKAKSKSSGSSSRRSRSSPSASQSPSLASPVAGQFPDAQLVLHSPPPREFEGFPHGLGVHTAGIEGLAAGFPSPGIGGGARNGKRDMGAFLANRGGAL
ncbi:hypothetical protein BC834DRAFT_975201 [Gloeopeniophorella convolvens]|nr:hypothetical protein BC834DRAFT_975201 [Gloeopeniophorella convolvens]